MSDLISRQALCKYAFNQKDKAITPNDIMRFPSAVNTTRKLDGYTEWLEEKLLECEPDILRDVVCNQDEIWCEENCKNMRPECLRKCYEICKG